jgi:hypothetical protein
MPGFAWKVHISMLSAVRENMGLLCSRQRDFNQADSEENAQVYSPLFVSIFNF